MFQMAFPREIRQTDAEEHSQDTLPWNKKHDQADEDEENTQTVFQDFEREADRGEACRCGRGAHEKILWQTYNNERKEQDRDDECTETDPR